MDDVIIEIEVCCRTTDGETFKKVFSTLNNSKADKHAKALVKELKKDEDVIPGSIRVHEFWN